MDSSRAPISPPITPASGTSADLAHPAPAPQVTAPAGQATAEENLTELVRLKEPFVLRDYQSRFEGASRNVSAISTLRTWQVTLTTGLVAVAYSQQQLPWWLIPVFLWLSAVAFLALEANEWVFLDSAEKGQIECEQALSVASLPELRQNIVAWKYGAVRSREVLTKQVRRKAYWSRMTKPWLLLWHLLVLVLGTVALLGVYAGHIAALARRLL